MAVGSGAALVDPGEQQRRALAGERFSTRRPEAAQHPPAVGVTVLERERGAAPRAPPVPRHELAGGGPRPAVQATARGALQAALPRRGARAEHAGVRHGLPQRIATGGSRADDEYVVEALGERAPRGRERAEPGEEPREGVLGGELGGPPLERGVLLRELADPVDVGVAQRVRRVVEQLSHLHAFESGERAGGGGESHSASSPAYSQRRAPADPGAREPTADWRVSSLTRPVGARARRTGSGGRCRRGCGCGGSPRGRRAGPPSAAGR